MPDLEVEGKWRLREAEVEANLCNVSKDVMLSQDRRGGFLGVTSIPNSQVLRPEFVGGASF